MKKRLFFYRILNSGTQKILRALCVLTVLFIAFTLPTTSFAWNNSSAYDCGNDGDFPMLFGGCKPGYYYENWEDGEDFYLGPDEVGECIACPTGYYCAGGFTGPMLFEVCEPGYYYENWQTLSVSQSPTQDDECIACPTGYYCAGGFSGPRLVGASPYEYDGGGSMYDCSVGHFPMRFGGCKAGYYYEDWQDADSSLHPDEVGECIVCPTGYTCAGGFAGPVLDNTPKFTITTTDDTDYFTFSMSAAGEFWVDWGDGTVEEIDRTDDTEPATYSHDYEDADEYTISFGGLATEYNDYDGDVLDQDVNFAAISFGIDAEFSYDTTVDHIASISGSLGAMFPTLNNGSNILSRQPRFAATFYEAYNMTGPIPATLFNGISGAPASSMFSYTFYNCSGLTGSIPTGLFGNISGAPASSMFSQTFYGCSGLTGSIPATLFSGISGAPADYMFSSTFSGCSGLTGSIPSGLFGNISGAPASSMFSYTFSGCSGLTGSIPATLFSGISGAPAISMFNRTFYGCRNLSGYIPTDLFGNLSGAPASSMFSQTFYGCSGLTGSIPATLFSGISGAPAQSMFRETFYGCRNLSGYIPTDLFGNLSGAPASNMFYGTFSGCSGLTGSIPSGLFGNLSGAPADYMFASTFSGCSGLTGSIPTGLFGNISGAPASSMFSYTFSGCSGLTGSIPATLFSGISGAPASGMFNSTFAGCSGLTGSIPATLFSGISGAPAQYMFYGTFQGCSDLTGFTDGTNTVNYVPGNFLSGITTNTSPTNQAQRMFDETGLLSTCPANTTTTTRSQFSNAGKPWCGTPYTITFNLNNGSFPAGVIAPSGYITEMTPATLPNPTRTAYTFDGWYDNAQFTGNAITQIASGSTGNKTYYAKWTEEVNNIITIIWSGASAEAISTNNAGQCTYGGDINTPQTAEHIPGKVFLGWRFSADAPEQE